MSDKEYVFGEWLCHYGVKGMKWGERHEDDDETKKAEGIMNGVETLKKNNTDVRTKPTRSKNINTSNSGKGVYKREKTPVQSSVSERDKLDREKDEEYQYQRMAKKLRTDLRDIRNRIEDAYAEGDEERAKALENDFQMVVNQYKRNEQYIKDAQLKKEVATALVQLDKFIKAKKEKQKLIQDTIKKGNQYKIEQKYDPITGELKKVKTKAKKAAKKITNSIKDLFD
jgi:hypothetical protein